MTIAVKPNTIMFNTLNSVLFSISLNFPFAGKINTAIFMPPISINKVVHNLIALEKLATPSE